ncbi:Sugar transferase involved in LPS biosynthesis (colanic, teichoic acid) [Austwickia chelonae]|uniref:Putative glycosyltransferase n=1 Tax=Austwickia chelonae NBRC 105200 TaxID=1184607 RepID=K6V7F3_9MICO|nr:sugar transferase [Austwickia chelonae]GAB78148.1 putative glycosyltransferase [Austwickia chelonae NBRC 105200]SEV97641.1 Sugar transferase involved in LPS biosynthesis (colanic, teichoic acid) [Austwickia chelonae]
MTMPRGSRPPRDDMGPVPPHGSHLTSLDSPGTKRAFDAACATVGLIVTSPVMAAIAVAVAVESPGGVLFRQERVGLNGKTFRIHKFRTMAASHDGKLVSATGDSRVTRVGRVLRASKLDELPQLIDVLRGEMSLVGPRPEVPVFVRQWPEELRPLILSVRPGITDPGSIVFRNEAEELAEADDPERHYVDSILPRKARLYAEYVRNRSFLGDLRLLGSTVKVVAKG